MIGSLLSSVQGAVFTPFSPAPASNLTLLEQKLLAALSSQADYIREIVARNETLNADLITMKKAMLQLLKQSSEEETTEHPSKKTMLKLVGVERQTYAWGLELGGNLIEPLCKGKYFQLKVKLAPLQETGFPTEERIQLSLSVYSADKTPKPLQLTMTGHQLVKGYPESMLSYSPADQCHIAYFKIQICEVSSHFRNGWVFLVVQPKYTEAGGESLATQIKPLVLENVVIRAKEIRNKRGKRKAEN